MSLDLVLEHVMLAKAEDTLLEATGSLDELYGPLDKSSAESVPEPEPTPKPNLQRRLRAGVRLASIAVGVALLVESPFTATFVMDKVTSDRHLERSAISVVQEQRQHTAAMASATPGRPAVPMLEPRTDQYVQEARSEAADATARAETMIGIEKTTLALGGLCLAAGAGLAFWRRRKAIGQGIRQGVEAAATTTQWTAAATVLSAEQIAEAVGRGARRVADAARHAWEKFNEPLPYVDPIYHARHRLEDFTPPAPMDPPNGDQLSNTLQRGWPEGLDHRLSAGF